jgi:hypothetical protein
MCKKGNVLGAASVEVKRSTTGISFFFFFGCEQKPMNNTCMHALKKKQKREHTN